MPSLTASEGMVTVPKFWKTFLLVVAIGKTAVAGAGITLALLGALDIAAAITAQHWMQNVQSQINAITAAGGVAGGVLGWFLNRA
jgi:hydroxyethylthiazole kinase-like sugar kinase family protein